MITIYLDGDLEFEAHKLLLVNDGMQYLETSPHNTKHNDTTKMRQNRQRNKYKQPWNIICRFFILYD